MYPLLNFEWNFPLTRSLKINCIKKTFQIINWQKWTLDDNNSIKLVHNLLVISKNLKFLLVADPYRGTGGQFTP